MTPKRYLIAFLLLAIACLTGASLGAVLFRLSLSEVSNCSEACLTTAKQEYQQHLIQAEVLPESYSDGLLITRTDTSREAVVIGTDSGVSVSAIIPEGMFVDTFAYGILFGSHLQFRSRQTQTYFSDKSCYSFAVQVHSQQGPLRPDIVPLPKYYEERISLGDTIEALNFPKRKVTIVRATVTEGTGGIFHVAIQDDRTRGKIVTIGISPPLSDQTESCPLAAYLTAEESLKTIAESIEVK